MQINLPTERNLKFLFKKYINPKFLLLCFGMLLPNRYLLSQEYFQQEVNYTVNVSLDDRRHILNAYESIQYINNSSDTLGFLYFHLWPNAYSSNETDLGRELIKRDGKSKLFNDPSIKGYIDSLNFEIGGKKISWNLLDDHKDICKLIPANPVKPGDTIIITTPFRVKIPLGGISRLGHVGESYQISQWYPKPAVYDRSGWHEMPYLDQGEFYSEFGNFDVSITLPSNYVVGATGNLQNDDEKNRLDKLSSDTTWLRFPYFREDDFPPSSTELKTLRYTEKNIHDFAWFADKRFRVMKGHVRLPNSGREVTTYAMFSSKEGYLWRRAISDINNALWNFSLWNGDYPYNSFVAVQSALNAGDGMEYPGLTVIGASDDSYFLDEVLAHEICHSWFYSAIGSDERRFPFMDESITAANESRYMALRYPDKKLWEINIQNYKIARILHADKLPADLIDEVTWIMPARLNNEQRINLPAQDFTYDNYGSIIYSKAPRGFNYLRSYLGNQVYDSVMHEYYRLWSNKHPQPADLRKVFESSTGKDLSWFFDDFLGTTKRLDYKIARYDNGKVLIRNKGKLIAPLVIAGMKGDSVISEKWIDGFEGSKWIDADPGNFTSFQIDPGHKMTELYRLNNNIRTSGIFPKSDPVHLQFLYAIEDPSKRYLIWFPILNWNRPDGFMMGAGLQNGSLIPRPVQYFVMPFYSFLNNRLNGYGKVTFNSIPYNSLIRLVSLSVEGEQFGAPGGRSFRKLKTGADLYFRQQVPAREINQRIFGYYSLASDLRQIEAIQHSDMHSYIQTGYKLERNSVVNPFNLGVQFESGSSYEKASLEINYKYSYTGKKAGLETRFFAGTMLKNDADALYSFSASGRSGTEDYLYQGVYPDRFSKFPDTFFSRQMNLSEGGLVSHVNDSLGYSRWLVSLSLSSSFPGRFSVIPIKPFINVLLNDHGSLSGSSPALFYEAGFKAGIWNVFEVWFPLLVSDNINEVAPSMKERIRFTMRLDKLRVRF